MQVLVEYYEVSEEAPQFYILCLISLSNDLQKINDYVEKYLNQLIIPVSGTLLLLKATGHGNLYLVFY